MRVVNCVGFGPVRDLVVEERPSPQVQPGTVKVAVRACGVNFVDGLLVEGKYQIRPPLPFVPGGEVCGVVTEVGEGVTSHQVGDRVSASTMLGAFAEEVVLPAAAAVHAPTVLTDAQAATYLQSYGTAHFALKVRAVPKPGSTMLVLGAGGGVGLAVVDTAVSMGVRVIAAASSADKREMALSRGAAAVIDTTTDDVKVAAREFGGGGVDAVFDPVGGSLTETAFRALSPGGSLYVVGFAGGDIPKLPLNLVLLANKTVVGVDWGYWSIRHHAEYVAMLGELRAAVERGDLHPVAPVEYRFDQAAEALADQLERRVTGKAALVL
ncbi:MAG TPA: NADPH:quinone oxidoreductase family protein [Ilumatobacteraceae bacterium]|nr:NADPH:quinone oxidoreductase family protein [Ilumatobacteraceae bacterium]